MLQSSKTGVILPQNEFFVACLAGLLAKLSTIDFKQFFAYFSLFNFVVLVEVLNFDAFFSIDFIKVGSTDSPVGLASLGKQVPSLQTGSP